MAGTLPILAGLAWHGLPARAASSSEPTKSSRWAEEVAREIGAQRGRNTGSVGISGPASSTGPGSAAGQGAGGPDRGNSGGRGGDNGRDNAGNGGDNRSDNARGGGDNPGRGDGRGRE